MSKMGTALKDQLFGCVTMILEVIWLGFEATAEALKWNTFPIVCEALGTFGQ